MKLGADFTQSGGNKTSWLFLKPKNGNLPQIGMKIKNIQNHHLEEQSFLEAPAASPY